MKQTNESRILKKLTELLHILYSIEDFSTSKDIQNSIIEIEKHVDIVIKSSLSDQNRSISKPQVTANTKPTKERKDRANPKIIVMPNVNERRRNFKIYKKSDDKVKNQIARHNKRMARYLSVISISSIVIFITTALIKILESTHADFIIKFINLLLGWFIQ